MPCQVKLYIKSIPGPMQQYYADTIEGAYVFLTVTQALADAFTEDLTGTQTCQWLEYWAEKLVQATAESSFADGQHSMEL